MKHLASALCLVLCIPSLPAADNPLNDARTRWLKGNYEEAREQFEALLKDAKTKPAAAVGLSKCHQSLGDYDKALAVVEDALKDAPRDADLQARRADLLLLTGKWDDAKKAIDAALEAKKDHIPALWARARLARDGGDIKTADADCRAIVKIYVKRSDMDDEIKDPDELLAVGLAGLENARWHILEDPSLSEQFDFVLNEVFRDAAKHNPDYWPAELHAGLLLLEKYNKPQADKAFNTALKANPNAAEALVGKGQVLLQEFKLKEAESFADRALRINPNLPEALRLRADIHLASGNSQAALEALVAARKVAPRDERTLARVAACHYLQNKKAEYEKVAKDVEAFDKKPALFYEELGESLEDRRRFDEAERCLKKAGELRPELGGPLNSLGMLYLRLGREKEASDLLAKGFKADPYNVRVSNSIKVLRHLEKYETFKTEHFEIRYDLKTEGTLAKYMGAFLEDVYADLAKKYGYKPKGPILVEVFNNHEMFSGRTVALPDLHTIGACTGRVVAMVASGGKGVGRKFNWGRVLRHEMVHIFNLEQTNFLVPHWYTEGLAVMNEGFPRPPIWNEMLKEKVPAGDLLNLDTIDLAFIRPRTPLEWQQAYCQANLYVEYLKSKYGPDTLGALLDAYRDGMDAVQGIEKVCKVDKATFEKGYKEYLADLVKGMTGKPPQKRRPYNELKEAYEKDADDVDTGAALAEATYDRGDRVGARKLAERVLERKKNQPVALMVLARLERLAGNVKKEKELLEAALDKQDPDPKVLKALGKLYYDGEEFDSAAEVYELGRKVDPSEVEWLRQLARVYAQKGDKKNQTSVLKDLVPTDADDFDNRKRLTRLLEETGDHAGAEKFAREALEIDVKDAEVRDMLLKALRAQKKDAEAERLEKLLKQ